MKFTTRFPIAICALGEVLLVSPKYVADFLLTLLNALFQNWRIPTTFSIAAAASSGALPKLTTVVYVHSVYAKWTTTAHGTFSSLLTWRLQS